MTSHTVKVKLVTIICGSELEARLARGLRSLGCVHGYTSTHADGRGLHGPRKVGFLDGGNLRLELILRVGDDAKVIGFLADEFSDEPLTAFVQDGEAIPSKQFAAT
jgi:hypothetical protein